MIFMYIDYKEQIINPFFSLPLVLGDTLRALTCSFQSGSQSTLLGQHSKLTVVEQAIFKIFVLIWGGWGAHRYMFYAYASVHSGQK